MELISFVLPGELRDINERISNELNELSTPHINDMQPPATILTTTLVPSNV